MQQNIAANVEAFGIEGRFQRIRIAKDTTSALKRAADFSSNQLHLTLRSEAFLLYPFVSSPGALTQKDITINVKPFGIKSNFSFVYK
jgi:hypothetical protein